MKFINRMVIVYIIIGIIMVAFCGCNNKNINAIKESEAYINDLKVSLLSKNEVITDKDVVAFIDSENKTKYYNEQFNTHYLRNIDNTIYSTYVVDNEGLLCIGFTQKNGEILVDTYQYLPKVFDNNDFKELVAGKSTINDVYNIDPNTKVLPLSTATTSYHELVSGKRLVIRYKPGDEIIDSIELMNSTYDNIFSKVIEIDKTI